MSYLESFTAFSTLSAAFGSSLIAGTFFAFSTFVMPALRRLPDEQGIAAMQSINVAVVNRIFLGTLLGTAALCSLLAVLALVMPAADGARLRFAGGVAYALGVVVLTGAVHIPRNDALARLAPSDVASASFWRRYLAEWTRWNHVRAFAAAAASALLVLSGCAPLQSTRTCDEPPAARLAVAPAHLSETGLYADIGSRTLAPGVAPFRPRFELWSDGAAKTRFVRLPPPGERDARIDTRDMDAWQFPKGTKLWKEIARGGRPVETRLLEKIGDGADDWLTVAYVWDEGGHDAIATPEGRAADGVPAARECMGCHGGTPGHVLGFSAIQLAGEPVLTRFANEGRFTIDPPRSLAIPGDETTRAALGYLHANCSHCHNQHRPERPRGAARCFDPQKGFDLSLRTAELSSPRATGAYRTAIGAVITPGQPGQSELVTRFEASFPLIPRMPAMGTKATNPEAAALLRRWIGTLRP